MLDETALTDALRCPACNVVLVEDGNFCYKCGLALVAPELGQVWETSQDIAALVKQRNELIARARHRAPDELPIIAGEATPVAAPAHTPASSYGRADDDPQRAAAPAHQQPGAGTEATQPPQQQPQQPDKPAQPEPAPPQPAPPQPAPPQLPQPESAAARPTSTDDTDQIPIITESTPPPAAPQALSQPPQPEPAAETPAETPERHHSSSHDVSPDDPHTPRPSGWDQPLLGEIGGVDEDELRDQRDQAEDNDPDAPTNTPDVGPLSARTTLLFAGAALLIVAALISTVMAWGTDYLAQTTALVLVTAVAAVATVAMAKSSLPVSGEALAAVTLGLLLLDVFMLRRSGLGTTAAGGGLISDRVYWGVAIAVVAAIAWWATTIVRIVPRLAVATLGQLPLPLLVADINSPTALALLLGGQALVLVAIEARWGDQVRQAEGGTEGRLSRWLRMAAGGGAALAFVVSVGRAAIVGFGFTHEPRWLAVVTLLALALVPWTVGYLHRQEAPVRHSGTGFATGLVLAALLLGLFLLGIPLQWMTACLLMEVLAVTLLASTLPRQDRGGPMMAATLYSSAGLIAVGVPVLGLLISPLSWWANAWNIPAWTLAPEALSPAGVSITGLDAWFSRNSYAVPAVVTGALATAVFATMTAALRTPEPQAAQASQAAQDAATESEVDLGLDPEPETKPAASTETSRSWIDQRHSGLVAYIMGTVTALTLPVVLPIPHVAAVGLQLAWAGLLLVRPPTLVKALRTPSRLVAGTGVVALGVAFSWSLASRMSTVLAGAAATALLVFATLRAHESEKARYAALTVIAACTEIALFGLAINTSLTEAAAVAALVAAALAVAAGEVSAPTGWGAQIGAGLAFLVGMALTIDITLMGWVALAGALAAAVVALRPERRLAAPVAGGLAAVAVAFLAFAYSARLAFSCLALTVVAAGTTLAGTFLVDGSARAFVRTQVIPRVEWLDALLAKRRERAASATANSPWHDPADAPDAEGAAASDAPGGSPAAATSHAPATTYVVGEAPKTTTLQDAAELRTDPVVDGDPTIDHSRKQWRYPKLAQIRMAAGACEIEGMLVFALALTISLPLGRPLLVSLLLAIGGATAAVMTLHKQRRIMRWAAVALLTAAWSVLLWTYRVTVAEAYFWPPALALLFIGVVQRRVERHTNSWKAYAPGLLVGLLPMLVTASGDEGLTRPLVLVGAALATTLIGARWRLQAPLAIGAGVLVVAALNQIAPYATLLPRWATVAGVGLVLFAIGTTYERRLRDLRRWHERFTQWS